MIAIVTVELPDGAKPVTNGKCSAFGEVGGSCTNVAGLEHSTLAEGADVDRIRKYFEGMFFQVARVEEISTITDTRS